MMRSFSHFILRRAGWVALLGTLLAFVGAYYSIQLYKNLRTNIEELLPTSSRAVINLDEVQKRLRSIDNLGVLIFSKNTQASKRFVLDLVKKLDQAPKTEISSVEYRITQELKFFKDRQALFIDLPDLIRIRDYVRDRIDYEKSLYNPLNIFAEVYIPEPSLDFNALRGKYSANLSTYDRFPDGFYATPDETKRAVLIYLAGESSSIDKDQALKHTVADAIQSLNPTSYASDLEIKYTGGVQDTIEEHDALIEDLELSTIIVMVVVTLAMWAFFRSARATFALVASLFMGTFWTFGLSYFAVGYLNANSAFLGSIVIGNGINCGIIHLARYLEERRRGRSNARAVYSSIVHTATSTWTAAGAAGLAYGSLILTDFRGFRQFGIIGLIGMVLCWISAYTLLPAYLTLIDRIRPIVRKGKRAPKPLFAGTVAWLVGRYGAVIWAISLTITIVSLAMFGRYNSGILETDLSQLRNKHSLESGSAYLSRYLDEIFQRYLSPLAILPRTKEDTAKIATLLKQKKAEEGKESLISSVQTLEDFVPKQQAEKLKVLEDIQRTLPPKIFYRMSETDQKLARQFLTPAVQKPITMKDLPPLLLDKFTEKDGSIGKLILVEPPVGRQTDNGDKLISFIHDLRSSADKVEPGCAVAGSLSITADMIQAISRDGPRATLFALIAVCLLVFVLFRNLRTSLLILAALFMGVTWLAGFVLGFWVKINFLNFIALPITFGIGVDYGVNIFQRYREEGAGNILSVIRHTGGAVALCSFTTIVGYCSLLIASNKAFKSFGLLAVAGELTCVTAALIGFPAFLLMWHRRSLAAETTPVEITGQS
jgi:predicted RND superfamily exporter protein